MVDMSFYAYCRSAVSVACGTHIEKLKATVFHELVNYTFLLRDGRWNGALLIQ
jgi:hypothetical protein